MIMDQLIPAAALEKTIVVKKQLQLLQLKHLMMQGFMLKHKL